MSNKYNIKIFVIVIMIFILVVLDQLIKYYIITSIYNSSIVVINGFLNLTYVENTGGAFGIGSNSIVIFILISIIVIGVLIKLLLSKKEELNKSIIASFSLIISGGIGNLIDRFFRGFVIDYIDISPIIKYPVFNFADICIVIGIIILIIDLIKNRDKL